MEHIRRNSVGVYFTYHTVELKGGDDSDFAAQLYIMIDDTDISGRFYSWGKLEMDKERSISIED